MSMRGHAIPSYRNIRPLAKVGGALLCPVGTVESSPAIYRWVHGAQKISSPVGTTEINVPDRFSRPYGTRKQNARAYPAINALAIVNRPYGTFARGLITAT